METLIANRYRIERILGVGGMGVVYRAYDHLSAQSVALKRVSILTDNLDFRSHTPTNAEQIANKRLGLALEFRTLAGLRHPHIISVMDYGFDTEQQPFFTMNLVENAQSLTDYARDLPREQQIQLLINVLQALAYLHRHGIIHRDLKPQNVLVGQDSVLKVMDFGLALNRNVSISKEKQTGVGTITYMAPELLLNAPATVQSDLYAVGVMIYELLAGQHPFNRQDLGRLLLQITNDEPDTSVFDEQLQTVILRLMAKQPDDRYDNAEQVITALCTATGQSLPQENVAVRESFLQAARFVGRDTELEQLRNALDSIFREQGSVWLVGGESGVGKSRLVDELHAQALVTGTMVLRGQGVANAGLPFQLWRQPARNLILSSQLSDLEASILKGIVPDISDLLGRTIPDAPELQGEAYTQRLVQTLLGLFQQATAPILLILEDLHWAKESLLPLRQIIKEQERFRQLLIVGTYRNDEHPNLRDELPETQIINLSRLSRAMIAELSVSILGEIGRQPAILTLLEQETEGNSFFIVEVMRALAEGAGRLSEIGAITLSQGIFTGGIRNILQRRLGQLPDVYQPLLKFAAVAGRQIELSLLEQAMPNMDIESWLYLGHDAAVLQISHNQWQFAHDKLREAVLLQLTDVERQTIHQQVATAIEQVHRNDSSYNEILLKHWRAAGNWEKECDYLVQVVVYKARVRADYDGASQLAQYGLERLSPDDRRRITLLIELSALCIRRGKLAQAESMAQEAQVLAKQTGDEKGIALSLNYLGAIACYRADYRVALMYLHESLAIRRGLELWADVAITLGNLSMVAERLGIYAEAHVYNQEAIEITPLHNQYLMSWNFYIAGRIAIYRGAYDEAHNYLNQSLEIRQARSDLLGIAWCLRELGQLALLQSNNREAHNYLHDGLGISQAIDDKSGIATSLSFLGTLATQAYNFDEAIQFFQQSLQITKVIDDKFGTSTNYCGLAFVKLKTNDRAAQLALHKALSLAYQIDAMPIVLEILVGCALFLFQQGHAVRTAEVAYLAQNHPSYHPGVTLRLADILPLLITVLDKDTLQSATTRGAQLDLDTVVAEILEEFAIN